jgi:hypothetical protein
MSSIFDITMNVKTGDYLMTNKTIEQNMKQLETSFLNAMDVLRLHKNTKWSKVSHKVDDEIVLKQILEGFIFEEKYAIDAHHSGWDGFRSTTRYHDETLEVEERKSINEDGDISFDYTVMETQLDTSLPENVQMNLQVFRVSEKRNTAMVGLTLTNEDFGYVLNNEIAIDFDTFKLKSREIAKVRSLFLNALTQEEQLLRQIEKVKSKLGYHEEMVKVGKSRLLDLTEKYASLFPMKEVAK